MSNYTNGDSSGGAAAAATLAYVPYQRKSHARNPSAVSQASTSSTTRTEPSAPSVARTAPNSTPAAPAPAAASSKALSNVGSHASRSQQAGTPIRTSLASAASSGATPIRSNATAPPPPPLVRIGGGAASRNLPAPPPLRNASVPPAASSQRTSTKAAGKQPEKPPLPRQPSAGTIALNQRSSSVASAQASEKQRRPASPSRSGTPASNGTDSPRPREPRNTHGRTSSRTAAVAESNGAGSSRSSPLTSGTSTPRLGSNNVNVPAHVHSYAALLAAQTKLGPIPVPQGVAIANAVGHRPQDSEGGVDDVAPGYAMQGNGRASAYRPGFQPRGAYRIRTDDFVELRRRRRGEGEMEEQRMERRLAKLIAIHFAPRGNGGIAENKTPLPASPMLDFDLSELRRDPRATLRKGGADLWSSLKARGRGEDMALRAAEQSIVNWQDDDEVNACPICNTAFSLTVRKHHCRLCGRVVCASPHLSRPAWPDAVAAAPGGEANREATAAEQRKQLEKKCSSLIIADPATGKIEDARDSKAPSNGGGSAKLVTPSSAAAADKGVRICRDCKGTIHKRQYMLDDGTVPAYLKLYEALTQVQKDIEESLPEFQEMVLGLQKHDHTAALGSSAKANIELQRDAAQARKQLLANFATYDELAKRIRKLPAPSSESGSGDAAQERVQQAIWTKANLFLQQNMLPLRSLPKPGSKRNGQGSDSNDVKSKNSAAGGARRREQQARGGSVSSMASFQTWFGGGGGGGRQGPGGGETMTLAEASQLQNGGSYYDADDVEEEDEEVGEEDAAALQEQLSVLLEQERLVAGYVESASRARKFDDARTLKASHEELCREVQRLQRRLVVKGEGKRAAY